MKKKILITLLILSPFIIAFLWWTVSPLFIDKEIRDDIPTEKMEPGALVSDEVYEIIDTRGHPASGSIRILKSEDSALVRYEDYEGTNGPDLFVYLAKDLRASDFVSLGRAKGNMGDINYEVPADVDVSEYRYVMTWCKAFGVLFDYSEIQ